MADKKLIIVVALVVVLAAIGAFQFLRKPANTPRPEPPKPKPEQVEQPLPKQEGPPVQVAATTRDPFSRIGAPAGADPTRYAAGTRGPDDQPIDMTKFTAPPPEKPDKPTPALQPIDPVETPTVKTEPLLNGCGWEVAGVLLGPKTCAVLRNSSGGERLVLPGQRIDENTQIVAVSQNYVTVKHKIAGTVRLRIGGGVVE